MATLIPAFRQSKLERTAGEIAQREAEVIAKQEELGAIQREADRKGRLAEALATQTAQAGASGIAAFEGSPLTILGESIKAEETATERDIFQTRLSALTTRAKGRVAKSISESRAGLSLLSSVLQTGTTAAGAGF
jgi:hypothetical protein